MKALINDSKSDDELIAIFEAVILLADKMGIKFISKKTFDRLCKKMYGKSIGSVIRNRFANPAGAGNGFGELKRRFGLQVQAKYKRHELIEHLFKLYNKLGRQPLYDEVASSSISCRPFESTFGKVSEAIKEMYREKGIKQEVVIPSNIKPKRRDRTGEDMSEYDLGILGSPVNEMGVVTLFAKIHKHIGFPTIVKIQQDFPDCVAECDRDGERFRAKIEFKFSSSQCYKNKGREGVSGKSLFLIKEVDYLVCWQKDSDKIERETPVEIISLKDELLKLPFLKTSN